MSLLPFMSSIFEPEYAADWLLDPQQHGGKEMMRVTERPFTTRTRARSHLMSFDLIETPDAYLINCDLPGVSMDKLEVSVPATIPHHHTATAPQDNCLVILAERSTDHDPSSDTVHSLERPFGKARRRITLPRDADLEKVTSKFKDGVLRIVVPKLGQTHFAPKKVAITSE